jgi:RNA polymerase sigma-70 factor (ECF subfamily)
MNVLYSLQHIGYTIPPQADAGWIGEAGPGPSYLDPGSGGPDNDFTNRNTTFMTWNLMHLARCSRTPAASRRTATSARSGTPGAASTSRTPSTDDTWLAVLTGLHGFRAQSSLRTWVYRILVNQAKSRGVRERRVVPFASLGPDTEAAGHPAVDPARFQGPDERFPGGWRDFPPEWPEQALLAHEVDDVVADALRTLPPRQRAVVTLRDLEGHTAVEVSDLMGISTGNQRVLLHRGRSVVRAHLEEYFATASVGRVG